MNISIFLKDKEFHIVCGDLEDIYIETETKNLADNIPLFISDIISKCSINNLENLIYSSGPCSFTSIRIINSIVKAFAISFPTAKFCGISHFLTYLKVLNETYSKGTIGIPTMRGDYFTSRFNNNKLEKIDIENLSKEYLLNNELIFVENSGLFSNINLAKIQLGLFNTSLFLQNSQFINTDLRINYGFTPEYSC